MRVSMFILTILLSLGFAKAGVTADNSWLVGVWELTSESKKEFLQFTDEMKVTLVSGKGRKIKGTYQITDDQIKVIYKYKGKKIPIAMAYNSSKDMLTSQLSNTGNEAKYKKSGN